MLYKRNYESRFLINQISLHMQPEARTYTHTYRILQAGFAQSPGASMDISLLAIFVVRANAGYVPVALVAVV